MTEREKQVAEINAILNPKPEAEMPPIPHQAPETLSPEKRETLFENWTKYIYARDPQTWTAPERDAIRFAAARALKESR